MPSPRRSTPNYCRLLRDWPHALLQTSGHAVGLPAGQMGNSEVGHMNIGAGRVVAQDLPRIDVAIEDGSLARRPVLLALIDKVQAVERRRACDGAAVGWRRAFAPWHHIAALVKILAAAGVPVFVHAFLDGRDTAPKSALRLCRDIPERD